MNERITLANGAGGRQSSELIETVFSSKFQNPHLTADDAAVLPPLDGNIAMTTDGFIVSPPFFAGGDIGKLSICGTVNDLSCMGARPMYMTAAFVIEEGFLVADLEKIASSMADTAKRAGVQLVAGDTKVAGKGQVDGLFITTTGIGLIETSSNMSGSRARVGDDVIVTGDIGRHGCAILLERGDYKIDASVTSDCAPLWDVVSAAMSAGELHTVRDATRGGVGTVLYEIASQSTVGIVLERERIPLSPAVGGVCDLLGLEPLYLACEGTMVMIAPHECSESIVRALSKVDQSRGATVIGRIEEHHAGKVMVNTEIGTRTFLPEPGNELLPRIC